MAQGKRIKRKGEQSKPDAAVAEPETASKSEVAAPAELEKDADAEMAEAPKEQTEGANVADQHANGTEGDEQAGGVNAVEKEQTKDENEEENEEDDEEDNEEDNEEDDEQDSEEEMKEEANEDKGDGKEEKKEEKKEGNEPLNLTKQQRKRLRRKAKQSVPRAEDVKVNSKKADLAGLIFMCNKRTKEDCFKHRVFGLPDSKKGVVEQVKKGNKLFLFDIDKRILHGVYRASSVGGMNLVPDAFKESSRKFPAQVRFHIHKECLPLDENTFKQAIKDNYFGDNKFKCELNVEQVQKLMKLFHRLDSRNPSKPKPEKEINRRPPVKNTGPRNFANGKAPRHVAALSRGGPPARVVPPARMVPVPVRQPNYDRDYALPYPRERLLPSLDYRPVVSSRVDLLEHDAYQRQLLQSRQLQGAAQSLEPLDYSMRAGLTAELARTRYVEDPYTERSLLMPRTLHNDAYQSLAYQRDPLYGSSYTAGLQASTALPYTSAAWRYM